MPLKDMIQLMEILKIHKYTLFIKMIEPLLIASLHIKKFEALELLIEIKK